MFNNKKWSEEELILLLHLYYRCARKIPNQEMAGTKSLSKMLKIINIKNNVSVDKKLFSQFRSPGAVVYKLRDTEKIENRSENLKTSKDHIRLFNYFSKNLPDLRKKVFQIMKKYKLYEIDKEIMLYKSKPVKYEIPYPCESKVKRLPKKSKSSRYSKNN